MQYQRRRGECGCLVAESQRNNFIYGDPDTGSGKGFDRTLINNQHNVGNMGLHIQLNYLQLLFPTSCKACDVWNCSFVQSWEVCHNLLGFNFLIWDHLKIFCSQFLDFPAPKLLIKSESCINMNLQKMGIVFGGQKEFKGNQNMKNILS